MPLCRPWRCRRQDVAGENGLLKVPFPAMRVWKEERLFLTVFSRKDRREREICKALIPVLVLWNNVIHALPF